MVAIVGEDQDVVNSKSGVRHDMDHKSRFDAKYSSIMASIKHAESMVRSCNEKIDNGQISQALVNSQTLKNFMMQIQSEQKELNDIYSQCDYTVKKSLKLQFDILKSSLTTVVKKVTDLLEHMRSPLNAQANSVSQANGGSNFVNKSLNQQNMHPDDNNMDPEQLQDQQQVDIPQELRVQRNYLERDRQMFTEQNENLKQITHDIYENIAVAQTLYDNIYNQKESLLTIDHLFRDGQKDHKEALKHIDKVEEQIVIHHQPYDFLSLL
ncbi:MAG: hypothetical protein MHMPM18_002584 [Marteilia pararefringens]